MPFTRINTLPTHSIYTISQRFGALSTGSVIGTSNLANCLGIAIRSNDSNVCCIAHVEAGDDHYERSMKAINMMMERMSRLGANSNISIALMGNHGNFPIDMARLPTHSSFDDFRTPGNNFGCFAVDPTNGFLHASLTGIGLSTLAVPPKDVREFSLDESQTSLNDSESGGCIIA